MRGLRIVIADADARVRSALRLLLEEELSAVVTGEAVTAREAIAAVAAQQPDVLVLDWDLVANDAALGASAVVKKLRAACPDMPIVALSCDPGAGGGKPAVEPDGLVHKGEPPDRLLTVLRSVAPR